MRLGQKGLRLLQRAVFTIPDELRSSGWQPYSRLVIQGDGANWVLSEIASELTKVCTKLGIKVVDDRFSQTTSQQSLFYMSKYFLAPWRDQRHRIAFPYFHGDPRLDSKNYALINSIRQNHEKISRIQVSHSEMQEIILETGIYPGKVFKIPISIDIRNFELVTKQKRLFVRSQLGIPVDAVVIGSFQKDGIGLRRGNKPKLIKGPDTFLKVLKVLRDTIPEIYVLLTGPARGYVKKGLEKLAIPYFHSDLPRYSEINAYFHALDLYLVTSREEGGPKTVLESMASGIPLVTTRVGQARDLVEHGVNGWLADVDDIEALVHCVEHVVHSKNSIDQQIVNGRETAVRNSYAELLPMWKSFMTGFVEF